MTEERGPPPEQHIIKQKAHKAHFFHLIVDKNGSGSSVCSTQINLPACVVRLRFSFLSRLCISAILYLSQQQRCSDDTEQPNAVIAVEAEFSPRTLI